MAEPNKGDGEEFFEIELLPGQSDKIMLSKELITQLETTEVFKKTRHHGLSYLYIQISRKPVNLPSNAENILNSALTGPVYLEDNQCGPASWLSKNGILPPIPNEILVYPVQPDNYYDYPTQQRQQNRSSSERPTSLYSPTTDNRPERVKGAPGFPRATVPGLDDQPSTPLLCLTTPRSANTNSPKIKIPANTSPGAALRHLSNSPQQYTQYPSSGGTSGSNQAADWDTGNYASSYGTSGRYAPVTNLSEFDTPLSPQYYPSPPQQQQDTRYAIRSNQRRAQSPPSPGLTDDPNLMADSRRSPRSASSTQTRQPPEFPARQPAGRSPGNRQHIVPGYPRAEDAPGVPTRQHDSWNSPHSGSNKTDTRIRGQDGGFSRASPDAASRLPASRITPEMLQSCPGHHMIRDDEDDIVMNWDGFKDDGFPF